MSILEIQQNQRTRDDEEIYLLMIFVLVYITKVCVEKRKKHCVTLRINRTVVT